LTTKVEISVSENDLDEGRFSRFSLIKWWDQDKIASTKVLVVGAGALGNEIIKNLALLGFRKVVVVDLDKVEHSNLSRSVLFRYEDIGKEKAVAAANGARLIYPEMTIRPLPRNIISGIGLGLFSWSDVIIGGLDNREARLHINRAAWKMNRPWIDGAIEGIDGVARVFLPGKPPCYECTLGEIDWAILDKRLSCNLLTREEMMGGRTATTPTISSIIGGIQVQEAVKLIHGMPTLGGKGFIFEGFNHTSYVVSYTENPDCMSHETFDNIVEVPEASEQLTLNALWQRACTDLDCDNATIDFGLDIVQKLKCPNCGVEHNMYQPVGEISTAEGRCPADGSMREVIAIHGYTGSEAYGSFTIKELGIPPFDVLVARSVSKSIQYLIAGDQREVLGELAC
jgi:molybdopterin/thiamine biosynthesis adenylyltransferase